MTVMEEYHLTVFAPRGLPEYEYDAIREVLDERRFRRDLSRAARQVFRRYPQLAKVKVRLSR
jgi:hypothetical protein